MSGAIDKFMALLHDPRLQSVRLTRMDSPGRGEDTAFQVILHPKTEYGRTCHSILRTPEAAMRRAVEEWDTRIGAEPETDDIEDLLA